MLSRRYAPWTDLDDVMQFQFNSDNRTTGDEQVAARIERIVRERLRRIEDRLTRVEVHLADVNGPNRRGEHRRCTIELRAANMDPISASDHAASVELAAAGAAEKALTAFDRQIGKRTTRKGH